MAEEQNQFENIKSIIYRAPMESENEVINNKHIIFTMGEDGENEALTFDTFEECEDYIYRILESKGYSLSEIDKAKEDGFFESYDPEVDPSKDEEVFNRLNNNDNQLQSEPEITYVNDSFFKEHPGFKKVLIGSGAAVVAGGLIWGGSTIFNNVISENAQNDKDTEKDFNIEQASFEEIMNQLEDGSLEKTEYQKVLNFCEGFNKLAAQPNNFRLPAVDGDNYLEISPEEALYTSVVLNNYSSDDLLKIFGTRTLDTDKVMAGYNSVCEKISTYNMNAKIGSGLEALINNPADKTFYHNQEAGVTEFNKTADGDEADLEMSDVVLAMTKSGYINSSASDKVTPGVAHVAMMPTEGFIQANANNSEYLKYNSVIDSIQGISKGENISDIQKEVNNKNYLSQVKTNVQSSVNEYNAKVAAKLSDSKLALVDALNNNGSEELASKVASRTDLAGLEKQIEENGADISDLYETYQNKCDELNPAGIPCDAIISSINEEIATGKTGDLELLQNNRVRDAYEKKQQNNNENEVVGSIKDNNSTSNQNKDNNTSSNQTPDNNNKDKDKDNNKSQQDDIVDNEQFVDQTSLGVEAANTYANTPGAYKYNGTIQNKYMDEPLTSEDIANMTPSQLWKEMGMAGIPMPDLNDAQIKEALNKASQGKAESYKEGWLNQIQNEINIAKDQAEMSLNDLDNLYQQSQNEVDDLNNHATAEVQGDNLTSNESSATASVVSDGALESYYYSDPAVEQAVANLFNTYNEPTAEVSRTK